MANYGRMGMLLALFMHGILIGQTTPPHYYHTPSNVGVNNTFFLDGLCNKFLFIYTQTEIAGMTNPVPGAITIDTIWFRHGGSSSNPSTTLTNFVITMGHSTLSIPNTTFASNFNSGPSSVVLNSPSYVYTPNSGAWNVPSDNWTPIPLQIPFTYNFTDNLAVQIEFAISSSGIVGNYADNSVTNLCIYDSPSTATVAQNTTSRPMFGISQGCGSPVRLGPDTTLCGGQQLVLSANNPNSTITWSTGATSNTITVSTAGTYWASVSDSCGVRSDTVVVLTSSLANNSTTTSIPATCFGSSNGSATVVPVGGIGPYTYNWLPSGGNAATATGLSAGTYSCTIIDAPGCQETQTVTVTAPPAITINTTVVDALCTGVNSGSITANVTGGTGSNYQYSWNTSPPQTTATINNLTPGSYTLTVTDANNCTNSGTATIGVQGSGPSVDAGVTTTIVIGSSLTLSPTGAASYVWSPPSGLSCTNCTNPIATPTVTTTYTVIGTDANGCKATDTVTIIVDVICGEVFVPNVFSPNGDNVNDRLQVYGNCITSMQLDIYDRWGNKVYSGTDQTEGWDGTWKGEALNNGIFAWQLTATRLSGENVVLSGEVQLLR